MKLIEKKPAINILNYVIMYFNTVRIMFYILHGIISTGCAPRYTDWWFIHFFILGVAPSINIQSFHPHSEILRGLEKHFESVDKIYIPDKWYPRQSDRQISPHLSRDAMVVTCCESEIPGGRMRFQ